MNLRLKKKLVIVIAFFLILMGIEYINMITGLDISLSNVIGITLCFLMLKKYLFSKLYKPAQTVEFPIQEIRCTKCGTKLEFNDAFCYYCGEPAPEVTQNEVLHFPHKVQIFPYNFDRMYSLTNAELLKEFINREINKAGIDKNSNLIPRDMLKRKKFLNLLFSTLFFVFVTSIFFHFPIYTYLIEIGLLLYFFKITRKYDFDKYLEKQIKSRPKEKISNIVMNTKSTFVFDNSIIILMISILVSIILPLIIFSSPRILYEKVDNGYAVRYYIFGLTNFKTVTIPENYKNEKVVSLRGNAFSNMRYLESVTLPDTITEIRGQAFKNCKSLKQVNIPKNLKYLGGSAFYNAKSIKKIVLPDTLVYLGGNSFFGASSLEYVKLSNNLTQIKGDSFENCISLKSITIPDSVTRIGGHAFYGDTSLSEVIISENSKLQEIGSSAFRLCDSLKEIIIPFDTYVNIRAFKESPTVVNRYKSTSEIQSDLFKNEYRYNSFLYFYKKEKEKISTYIKSAEMYDCYITLIDIRVNGDYNEYDLLYEGKNNESVNFTLTKDTPYKKINDNLLVSVSGNYVFDKSRKAISLNVYYN